MGVATAIRAAVLRSFFNGHHSADGMQTNCILKGMFGQGLLKNNFFHFTISGRWSHFIRREACVGSGRQVESGPFDRDEPPRGQLNLRQEFQDKPRRRQRLDPRSLLQA